MLWFQNESKNDGNIQQETRTQTKKQKTNQDDTEGGN